MKSAMMIVGAIIILLLLAATLAGIDAFRMTEYEELHNITTTSNNSTDVTLTQALYSGETRYVSISSNLTDDAPVPSSYTSSTRSLTIGGLKTSSQRMLTVDYQIDALGDYYAISVAVRIIPLLLGLGAIGLVVGAIYNAVSHGE